MNCPSKCQDPLSQTALDEDVANMVVLAFGRMVQAVFFLSSFEFLGKHVGHGRQISALVVMFKKRLKLDWSLLSC